MAWALERFQLKHSFAYPLLQGIDLDLEMLYGVPYGNLFTNINFGRATSPFGWVIRGQVRRCRAQP